MASQRFYNVTATFSKLPLDTLLGLVAISIALHIMGGFTLHLLERRIIHIKQDDCEFKGFLSSLLNRLQASIVVSR